MDPGRDLSHLEGLLDGIAVGEELASMIARVVDVASEALVIDNQRLVAGENEKIDGAAELAAALINGANRPLGVALCVGIGSWPLGSSVPDRPPTSCM